VTRLAAFGCACAAAAVLATPSFSSSPVFRGPFGHGANRVWLLLPHARPTSVVVFLHGWKIASPSPNHPWVGQFRPWLDHLVQRGSAVLFPAYQIGGDAQGPARVQSLRRGLETGFRLVPPGIPVIVAGYSYGASLGFYYAADAASWGLRLPAAVDAVFPAGMIPGAPLPRLPTSVNVLIEVGDRDTVAGRGGADAFFSWLATRHGSRQRLVVVRSTPGFAAVHAAPKLTTSAAKRAFWSPLDALVGNALTAQRAPSRSSLAAGLEAARRELLHPEARSTASPALIVFN
jgi:hypothetical protein